MEQISKLEQLIRNYVNDTNVHDKYFLNKSYEWSALCAAMDTLGDTCEALLYYERVGVKKLQKRKLMNYGEQYFKLYGMLEAIFLQQEAIRQIHRAFLGNDFSPDETSAWCGIRHLRNLTISHPINHEGKEHCLIVRAMMSDDEIELMIHNENGEKLQFQTVKIRFLYDKYKCDAISCLKNILNEKSKLS